MTNENEEVTNSWYLPDATYNVFKKIVQTILPALGTLYFGLSEIWDLPAAKAVVGSLAVIATFLSVVLGISGRGYRASDGPYAGEIDISEVDGKKVYSLVLNGDPAEIDDAHSILFKVKSVY